MALTAEFSSGSFKFIQDDSIFMIQTLRIGTENYNNNLFHISL